MKITLLLVNLRKLHSLFFFKCQKRRSSVLKNDELRGLAEMLEGFCLKALICHHCIKSVKSSV